MSQRPITSVEMLKVVMVLGMVVSACGGSANLTHTGLQLEAPPQPQVEASLIDIPVSAPALEARPVWSGFEASQPVSEGLAGYAIRALDVYESPDTPDPFMTLDATTIIGTVTVLGVITPTIDGWAEVMLPVRPNGRTGWVKASGLEMYVADSEIVVDLAERRLTYMVGGVEVLSTEVGIGSVYNETPTGHFFVTDNVTLANPDSPWGPHALGLSARSDTVTSFNGGDGIIGIHGTNNPSSIGGNISLGCVRLPNEMITALHHLVPIGTRVTINA